MALKKYRPMTPGTRGLILLDRSDITSSKPEKALVKKLSKRTGRNNQGKITCRHKGGGTKKMYRPIDFKRDKIAIPGLVKAIEYDPNRNVHLALVYYPDGEKRYILCPSGLKIGDKVESGPTAEIRSGNSLPMTEIPLGSMIHNIEMKPGCGGQLVRSAGCSAQLLAVEGEFATLRMPSGEMRKVRAECYATIGELGNSDWKNIVWGKAGRNRHRGIKPTVRGSAMNPVDHRHGGGEGRSPIGGIPRTHSGKRVGLKTRKMKKSSSKLIITNRRGRKVAALVIGEQKA